MTMLNNKNYYMWLNVIGTMLYKIHPQPKKVSIHDSQPEIPN